MNSDGSLRFLITWCPATETIDCILLPLAPYRTSNREITFSFMLKLLGAFISSTSVASKAFSFSCVFSFSSSSLTFYSNSFVTNSCWTLFKASLAASFKVNFEIIHCGHWFRFTCFSHYCLLFLSRQLLPLLFPACLCFTIPRSTPISYQTIQPIHYRLSTPLHHCVYSGIKSLLLLNSQLFHVVYQSCLSLFSLLQPSSVAFCPSDDFDS